ncbi:sensor histidine kinase [Paenibacillus donghaensis]|uniref:sensor histidine kinase n=1 Tax=Paenibacillus donghaensis TaxID=414771 RepID=UPI0018839702|nr:sensor histidine kinase [Paenibacillus donghaensis]MBE9914994.1 sensor histidine kinase [Paenibacillus donghaensis]
MRPYHSLRFKLVLAILLIFGCLVSFLFYNNRYAMNVVQSQAADNYSFVLSSHVREVDRFLDETRVYMGRNASDDSQITMMAVRPLSSLDYHLALLQTIRKLYSDLNYYSKLDTMFLYYENRDELIVATLQNFQNRSDMLAAHKREIISATSQNTKWSLISLDGTPYLIKVIRSEAGIYMGALVSVGGILAPLNTGTASDKAQTMVYLEGMGTVGGAPEMRKAAPILAGKLKTSDKHYVQSGFRGPKDLVVGHTSSIADMTFITVIPQKTLLENLPYFERIIYAIPFAGFVLFVIYLFFIERVLFIPMKRLMSGMRKVGQGMLGVRLANNGSHEFSYLVDSFNGMVTQIKELKIDIYEEQLRVQRAELRHLQMQINPHFFFNSLHIINNLIRMKNDHLAEKMVRHLANYFRFITKTGSAPIPVRSELDHINDYLSIQKLMYPTRLEYAIECEGELSGQVIPPLTVQPFVENTIVHVLMKRNEPLSVRVCVSRDPGRPGSHFTITVEDNGPGFPEEILRSGGTLNGPGDGKHVGIGNVGHRLRMIYRDGASIRLESREGGGARVLLSIPLTTESEGSKSELPEVSAM